MQPRVKIQGFARAGAYARERGRDADDLGTCPPRRCFTQPPPPLLLLLLRTRQQVRALVAPCRCCRQPWPGAAAAAASELLLRAAPLVAHGPRGLGSPGRRSLDVFAPPLRRRVPVLLC